MTEIEIEELRLANQQAAEYGLALLEERNFLKNQYQDLENQYELLKYECEELRNQLKTIQINKHDEIFKAQTDEECLLNEKEINENYFINEIKTHKQELSLLKQNNESLTTENKHILVNYYASKKEIQELNELNQKLKNELKEIQNQERILIDTNSGLTEENVFLQERVEKLAKNLINYDKLNVENIQLKENINHLQQTMKDLESLKTIAESQITELHETLRDERKQKHSYKLQLNEYKQKESLQNLNSLRMKIGDIKVNSPGVSLDSVDDDDDDHIIHRLPSIDFSHTSESDPQLTGSLFSEIHGNDIRKLEDDYSQIKSSLDNQLLTINEKLKTLLHKIEYMIKRNFPDKILSNQFDSDDTNELLNISIDLIEQIDQDVNLKLTEYNDTFIKTHENLINFNEDLGNLHSSIFISNNSKFIRQPSIHFDNQLFDPTINEHILNILHEKIQQFKQSFEGKKFSIDNQDEINLSKKCSLLNIKQEQINTLRKLLKDNQETSELALTNLKSTYENEKQTLIETITKLRSELKLFKEQTATFSSRNTMLLSRCEEYTIQLTESQRQIQVVDEEKRALNSLLRMVMDQKLLLTEKLERFETNPDRSPNLSRRANNFDIPQNLLAILSNTNNSSSDRGRYLSVPTKQSFPSNRS